MEEDFKKERYKKYHKEYYNKYLKNQPKTTREPDYAIYKGDKFIFIGTMQEVMDRLHVKKSTVQWWSYPACHKRAEGTNRIIAIKVED